MHTVGEALATEAPLLKPLPEEPFQAARWFRQRVERYAQVTVCTNRCSVPVQPGMPATSCRRTVGCRSDLTVSSSLRGGSRDATLEI